MTDHLESQPAANMGIEHLSDDHDPKDPVMQHRVEAISIGSVAELIKYEEDVIFNVLCNDPANFARWQRRPDITQHLRPKKPQFYGTIGNIILVKVESPVAVFLDNPSVKLNIDGNPASGTRLSDLVRMNTDPADNPREQSLGYNFFAEATSTGRGVIGTINSMLLYAAVPLSVQTMTHLHPTYEGYLYGLRRYIARPSLEKTGDESPEEILKASILRASNLERARIKNPLQGGLPGTSNK